MKRKVLFLRCSVTLLRAFCDNFVDYFLSLSSAMNKENIVKPDSGVYSDVGMNSRNHSSALVCLAHVNLLYFFYKFVGHIMLKNAKNSIRRHLKLAPPKT